MLIQHAIEIAVPRHALTVGEDDIAEAMDSMRRWITDALHEYYGVGGHLSMRWELAFRTLTGNLMLRSWHPGEDLPVNTKTVTLIGQGFAHTLTGTAINVPDLTS